MDRRTFLRVLLASAVAEAVDVERLLWTPKPMVTVPEMPLTLHPDAFRFVMEPITELAEMQRRYNYYRSLLIEQLGLSPEQPFVISRTDVLYGFGSRT